jgi:chromosome segregation ATPase
MKNQPTPKELDLAGRVHDLDDAASRPKIAGGGLLAEAFNFVTAHVPRRLVAVALVVFLSYHAWDYYNRAQQMVAQLEAKRAEAVQTQTDADAQNAATNGESVRSATIRAELARLEADAATAKAEAEAQSAIVEDKTARLATLQAELEKTQAEAARVRADAAAQGARRNGDTLRFATLTAELAKTEADAAKARAEADAQNQVIDGMPLAVAQKKAEVETAEAQAGAKIQSLKNLVNVFVSGRMTPTGIFGR